MQKKIFTYDEALELLPQVRELTATAVSAVDALGEIAGGDASDSMQASARSQEILAAWAAKLLALGVEVKGVWLVDFDSGSGYYCWKYPEESLQYFHGYDEGFRGRIQLN